jgi:hypothetical protein
MIMRKTVKVPLVAAGLAAFILASVPLPVMAMGGMGGSKSGKIISCKSGAKVKSVKECKENGGKH